MLKIHISYYLIIERVKYMKKYLILTLALAFFFLFNNQITKAESKGTCFIKQQEKTYSINTPFFWYEVRQTTIINNNLSPTITYNHKQTYISDKDTCLSINNSIPSYENITTNTIEIKTYYYSQQKIENSEEIFNKSPSIFKNYSDLSQENLTITSDFLSLDNSPPIIANENINPVIITPLETIINLNYLKSKLTAYDEVDGTVNVEIYEDNYSKNHDILGEYKVLFSASDTSNNTAYLTIIIKVIDNIKPLINGQQSLKNYISNPLTIQQIKNSLTVSDNYDKNLNELIIVTSENYTNNIKNEGIFQISFKVSDLSNNESDIFTVNIENYDDISPTLIGEKEYKISNKNKLDLNKLKSQMIANDNLDQSPTISITEDNYTFNYYNPGIYQVTYICKDKNNNYSTPLTINIIVEDTTKPIFYISKNFIGIDGNASVTIDQLLDIIEQANNIDKNNLLSYEIIKDDYSANKNTPGQYELTIEFNYKDKDCVTLQTYIVVDTYSSPQQKSTPNKTFWSAIKNFFIKIINFIKYIFSFSWLKK